MNAKKKWRKKKIIKIKEWTKKFMRQRENEIEKKVNKEEKN